MRKALLALIIALTLLPVAFAAMQDSPAPTIEITGVNPTELPVITVTTTVLDSLGQPVDGLTAASFQVTGELADKAQIVSVRRIEDENLTVAVVLVIDVSSSMAGRPFSDAQEAAKTFVNTVDENTTIAIVTFSNSVQLVQDYTTDKPTLLNAIDSLFYGGQTSLYEGTLFGVQKAAQAPSPRRFVVLLSDGAQFETESLPKASREAAATEALAQGVPVYTIGLGFGADRSYLDQISSLTNARFFESPTSDQLQQIYTNLAQLLRSQYEVVLNIDLPADGTFYDLGLQVTTQQGTVNTSASLRTPIPIPIVQAPILDGPISELTEARAAVLSDDGVASVEIKLDGVSQTTLTAEPYSYMLDPLVLTPGEHQLEYIATDANGDVGSDVLEFTVASLKSTITFMPELPTEEISQAQTFGLQIGGQTLPQTTTYSVDGGESTLLVPPAYAFTIDPLTMTPGEHTYTFTVLNQAGVTTTEERTVTIADLPPKFVVIGLQDGDIVSEPVEVTVQVLSSQADITGVGFNIEASQAPDALIGAAHTGPTRDAEGFSSTYTLEPGSLPPGPTTLSITVRNAADQSASTEINFQVAALPAQLTISGIDLGETIETNPDIEITAVTQPENDVNSVVLLLDNNEISRVDRVPATFTFDVSDVEPGPHVLSVTATTTGGQSSTSDLAFIIGEGPSLTQTALVTPTDTPTLTPTPTFTPSPTPTIDSTATAVAQAALVQVTADAQSTADTINASTTSTAQAESATTESQGTLDAQAAVDAQATEDKQATVSAGVAAANATAFAQATIDTQATVTTEAEATEEAFAQATIDAQGTVTAEVEATQEAIAQATTNIESTSVVQTAQALLTATQMLANQQATTDAQSTANAQATIDAQSTLDAQAMAEMVATANAPLTMTAAAQTTLDAQATTNAEASATANAQETLDAQASAIANLEATQNAQSTLDAQATRDISGTATQSASDVQATRDAQATITAEARLTADIQATRDAQATLDAAVTTTADAQATLNAQETLDAQASATANAQATLDAQAALSVETEVVTDEPTEVQPTEAGTPIAQAATESSSPTPTLEEVDRTPVSTVTPIGTLIPQQAETAPESNNALPILIIIIIVVVILVIISLVLSRARRNNR